MSSASRIAAWSLTLTIASMLDACVSIAVPPPSEELRQSMRGMEVEVVHAPPADEPKAPVAGTGDGAAATAGRWAGAALAGGATGCYGGLGGCVLGLALGVVVAPVAAVVGAVVGGVKAHGHSQEEVATAETRLRDAVAALDPVQGLKDALTVADPQLGVRVTPASTEEPVRLEITVLGYGLVSEGRYEPEVSLVMSVSGRVLRGEGGEELYWRVWSYRGPERPYFSLAGEASTSVRAMAEEAYRATAERMLYDLFQGSVDEPVPNKTRPVATVAAKYMRRNSELHEYEMSEVLGGHTVLWDAGRLATAQKAVAETPPPQGMEPPAPLLRMPLRRMPGTSY